MIIRSKDLRNMGEEEIQKKMNEIQVELIRQKGKKTAGGTPENPGRMRALRRAVARIITVQKEMEKKQAKPKEKSGERPKAPVAKEAKPPVKTVVGKK